MIQKSLISKNTRAEDEKRAVLLLKSLGYEVIQPKKKKVFEEKAKQLEVVKLFYNLLKDKIGDQGILFNVTNEKEDEEMLQRYLVKADRLGINIKTALEYLEEAIKFLFKEIDLLGLKTVPQNFSFLLSKNGNWILSKIRILKQKQKESFEFSEQAENYKELIYDTEDERLEVLRKERYNKLFKEEN